jgi:membrane fusion protein (multidrug efflux system)
LIAAVAIILLGCGKGDAKDAADAAADQEAAVVAKVAGEVRELLVEEGDRVRAGQVLARLDGDRLRFELQQTEANLRKLEREYQRTLELFNRKLVASVAVDNVRYEMEALKAARDLAQLNLGYTEIRAPIAGVASASTTAPSRSRISIR